MSNKEIKTEIKRVNGYLKEIVTLFDSSGNPISQTINPHLKRVIITYLIAISSIVLLLALIDKFPIFETPYISIKRVIIIGFPTIFAAVISDFLK